MNIVISIGGVDLEVSGNYYRGHYNFYGEDSFPSEPELFDIDYVYLNQTDIDITGVLEALGIDWGIISDKCIQAVHDKFEQELEDRAVEQHEWKMFEEKQMFEEHAYCGY